MPTLRLDGQPVRNAGLWIDTYLHSQYARGDTDQVASLDDMQRALTARVARARAEANEAAVLYGSHIATVLVERGDVKAHNERAAVLDQKATELASEAVENLKLFVFVVCVSLLGISYFYEPSWILRPARFVELTTAILSLADLSGLVPIKPFDWLKPIAEKCIRALQNWIA